MTIRHRLVQRLQAGSSSSSRLANRRALPPPPVQQRRSLATATEGSTQASISAAPAIDLSKQSADASKARIIPASPSYFSSQPGFNDNLVQLLELLRRYEHLPTVPTTAVPRIAWKTLMEYRAHVGETVQTSRYNRITRLLERLHRIHPSLKPKDVLDAIERHRRPLDPYAIQRQPRVADEFGRAYANGRRKSSRANVLLVEGDGEILINGHSITQHFGRVHDRDSAILALKVTNRLDKYNLWATVHGGGTTGQAESLTLAVAKALLVHEPALKPALRRGTLVFFFLFGLRCFTRLTCVGPRSRLYHS